MIEAALDVSYKNALDTVALVGAVVAFAWGLWQYGNAQRWKRLEFLAGEIKIFDADPLVIVSKQILDWNDRDVYLNGPLQPKVNITDAVLGRALRRQPREAPNDYDDNEVAIRDVFDGFFSYLDRFETYIESGLFTYEVFHPYLSYWLDIIADPNSAKKAPNLRKQLRDHVEYYYPPSADLLRRYDKYVRKGAAV